MHRVVSLKDFDLSTAALLQNLISVELKFVLQNLQQFPHRFYVFETIKCFVHSRKYIKNHQFVDKNRFFIVRFLGLENDLLLMKMGRSFV